MFSGVFQAVKSLFSWVVLIVALMLCKGLMAQVARSSAPNLIEWRVVEREWLRNQLAEMYGAKKYYPDSDPTVRFLQGVSDRLYWRLLAVQPSLSDIPKPVIQVIIHKGINAFATSIDHCFSVPISFEGHPGPNPGKELILRFTSSGKLRLDESRELACEAKTNHVIATDIKRYLVENRITENCSLRVESGTLFLGKGCLHEALEFSSAQGVQLKSMTNYITLTSSLIQQASDPSELIFVIIHELAHYYRSHGALNKKRFHYFYKDSQKQLERRFPKPTEDKALLALGKQVQKIKSYNVYPVKDQFYNSSMYLYLDTVVLGGVKAYCEQQKCAQQCETLIAFVQDKPARKRFGFFPLKQLPQDQTSSYFKYERLAHSCLQAVPVGPAPIDHAKVGSLLWKLSPKMIGEMDNLEQAFYKMSQIFAAEDAAEEALLKKAFMAKLGFYTTEQEADNLAIDWMIMMGHNPAGSINHWFRQLKRLRSGALDLPMNYGYDSCLQQYQMSENWGSPNAFGAIPVGGYTEIHHSICYRIYNITRRIQFEPNTAW